MRLMLGSAALLALAGCSGADQSDVDTATPSALVTLGRASIGSLQAQTTIYGSVDAGASARADLVAPAEATVARIAAPVGTRVRVGQVVAVLSPSPTTRLEQTRAATDALSTSLALARAERLQRDGLVANADVEAARAAARTAAATQASVTARTQGFTLRSAADGFVETVSVTPGTLVPAGGAVASIVRTGKGRARFGVPPEIARSVRVGQPIRLTTPAGPLTVSVASVDPVVDPQTRLASIYTTLLSGTPAGATISASLSTGGEQRSVVIPYAALLDDAGQPFVYVVANGVAHRRNVAIGVEANGQVAIATGLKGDEAVVVKGGTAIEDGMKVRTR